MKNPFRDLNRFEKGLWLTSVLAIAGSAVLSGAVDALNVIASLIGVTALIFVAKGYVLGQVLTVVFAAFYGVISFFCQYYGEMITYLGMSAPMAALAAVEWLRNPYRGTREVQIRRLTKTHAVRLIVLSLIVTVIFYFILKALGNASLFVSTLSVTTSFLASMLTYYRSPWYAAAYAANDLVLIVLWIIASETDPACMPMIACFAMFFLNDMYGFINWRRMAKRQESGENA